MLQNNATILDFFSKFPNQPFEFVIVTDINIKEHPSYYKAIFRNIKTNKYFSYLIAPEMMRYKHKVGHIYTNGELVDDCSTDERVVQIAKDSGCIYIRTQYQSGFDGHPFNVGVQNANGDYICRVDSDDILLELPSSMKSDIWFGKADRVLVPNTSIIEELILAPRAILNGMVIKKELLLKYPSSEDASIFGDVLLVLRLIYNQYSHDFCETINYIYRKHQGSIQTSKSPFYHRLRLIQTVARFCQLENIEPKQSIRYLELAMLNVKYGSKSRKVLVKN